MKYIAKDIGCNQCAAALCRINLRGNVFLITSLFLNTFCDDQDIASGAATDLIMTRRALKICVRIGESKGKSRSDLFFGFNPAWNDIIRVLETGACFYHPLLWVGLAGGKALCGMQKKKGEGSF